MIKARQATSWIVTDPDHLSTEHHEKLQRLLARSPALASDAGHVREFAKMLKTLTGQQLQLWYQRDAVCAETSNIYVTTGAMARYG